MVLKPRALSGKHCFDIQQRIEVDQITEILGKDCRLDLNLNS